MLELKNVDQANVTIVFEKLDKDLIKRNIARKALGEDSTMVEFPDVLFMEAPGAGRQANFAGRRLSINSTVTNIEDAATFVGQACEILLKATDELNAISYGYNLRGSASKSGVCVREHLLKICFGSNNVISQAINAEIFSVTPKFSFDKHGANFNVTLMHSKNKDNPKVVNFHCNIHFEDTAPPVTEGEITAQLLQYSDYCFEILEKILEV